MKSTETVLTVLEAVGELQPVGVSDIARKAGISKTSAHRFLHSLEELGWIQLVDSERIRWSLSSRVLTLSGHFVERSDLRESALEPMRELSRLTGETIHLTIPEGEFVVLLHKIESTKAVRAWSYVGGRRPLFATASGKAILAWMDPDDVAALLAKDLEQFTENTLRSVAELNAELELARHDGFTVNKGEWLDEVSAVAAPILGPDRRPVGALSISVPSHRLEDDSIQHLGELVSGAAGAAAGHPWPVTRG